MGGIVKIEEKEYKKCKIEIGYDECAESPVEWQISRIVAWHPRYTIGQEYIPRDEVPSEGIDRLINSSGVMSVDHYSELMAYSSLYMYDHSGITISTSPFYCHWDSGQVGYVYITKKDAARNKIKTEKEAMKIIEDDVQCYDRYIRGEIHYYCIYDQNGDIFEQIYNIDDSVENLMVECQSIIDKGVE